MNGLRAREKWIHGELRKEEQESAMAQMPTWDPPANIVEALKAGDGCWEDERWSPIILSVLSNTMFDGREIPLAWQIEFDPSDEEFEAANERLAERGIEPDGYGWGEYIQMSVEKANPTLARRLHATDCEAAACVVWVESAEDCRELLKLTWMLIFD